LIIALSFFNKNFLGIVGAMVVCFGGWYFAYFLYVSRIVKSLPPVKTSYKELVLAQFESDDSEKEDSEKQTETRFPAQWSKPIPQITSDPFFGIKRILYRLSPGQLFMLYIFAGIGIIMIWSNFQLEKFGESPIDFLIACLVCILWGLAGFVVARNMESEKKDWWGFLNWKLPMILIAAACWILAIVSLYKFIVVLFA
jgi:hypothetical protein